MTATATATQWISAPDDWWRPDEEGCLPAVLLGADTVLGQPPEQAVLAATALGVYEVWINGVRVGDEQLAPGWTDFAHRVRSRDHDVTALLRTGGPNRIRVLLAAGWYAGHNGQFGTRFGTRPAARVTLRADGRPAPLTWHVRPAGIVRADLVMGETTDAGTPLDHTPVGDAWSPAAAVPDPGIAVEPDPAPPVRVVEEFPAVSVASPRPGLHVVDFGRNIVGRVSFRVHGPEGHRVTVRHAEELNLDGTVYTDNLRGAAQRDELLCSGGAEDDLFQPRFTVHGFRYAQVEGLPGGGPPDPGEFRAQVLTTDLEPAGALTTSDPLTNQLLATARTAAVLGRDDEAKTYDDTADRTAEAFRGAFTDGRGRLTPETQTGYALALAFGLLRPDDENEAAGRLAGLVRADGHRIATGFLGTPLLLPVLTDHGHAADAWAVFLQDDHPGWRYQLRQGATTMWERWNSWHHRDGFAPAGMNSFNHYAFGCVGEWLYRHAAGIDDDPDAPEGGWRRFRLRPHPSTTLRHLTARHRTRHGWITSAWQTDPAGWRYQCTVPPGTEAALTLPVRGAWHSVTLGGQGLSTQPLDFPYDRLPDGAIRLPSAPARTPSPRRRARFRKPDPAAPPCAGKTLWQRRPATASVVRMSTPLHSGVILFHRQRLAVRDDFTLPVAPVPRRTDPAAAAVEAAAAVLGGPVTVEREPCLEVRTAGARQLYFRATPADDTAPAAPGALLLTREEAVAVPLAPWAAAEALLRSWAGEPWWGRDRLVVDDPQGRPPKRSRAGAVVIRDGRMLLIEYRGPGPNKPPVYEIPGGGIERGETPRDAVLRELKEETGLTGTVLREIARVNRNIRGSHPGHYFLVDAQGDFGPRAGLDIDTDDADPVWVPLAELPSLPLWPKRLGWRVAHWARHGWPDEPAVLCDSLWDLTTPCDW